MVDEAPDHVARNRYFLIVLSRIVAMMGAVFALVLYARAPDTEIKLLAGALLLASLWLMATLPAALARRWRSPRDE